MDKDVQNIILEEIRTLRKDVSEIKAEVWSIKTKLGMVALFFGFFGAFIKDLIGKKFWVLNLQAKYNQK